MYALIRSFLVIFFFVGITVQAEINDVTEMPEESFIVPNGQGISSPSFADGLVAENPAGLVLNHSIKFRVNEGLGNYGGVVPSINSSEPSGSLLMGNGMIGAGLSGGGRPYSCVDWGVAGRIPGISTALGFSAHTHLGVVPSTYDIGILFEAFHDFRDF